MSSRTVLVKDVVGARVVFAARTPQARAAAAASEQSAPLDGEGAHRRLEYTADAEGWTARRLQP